jgi:hypothetical protein
MVHPGLGEGAARLKDGAVLVVGDEGCVTAGAVPGSERSEVYDPATDSWTEVGSLNKPRNALSIVALPDGSAMVLGGINEQDEPFSSTKRYSPTNHTWTNGPLMQHAGAIDAVVLPDGRVMAAATGWAELLDAKRTKWSSTKAPPSWAFVDDLELLSDGLVAALGERDDEERAPIMLTFDPARKAWQEYAPPEIVDVTPIALQDGSLLLFGHDTSGARVRRTDLDRGTWVEVAKPLQGRANAQMTLLPDGRVLVAGGTEVTPEAVANGELIIGGPALQTTEIYDPASDTWTAGPPLLEPRQGGTAVTLADGSVLVFGGYGGVPGEGSPNTGGEGPCPEPMATTERLAPPAS